MRNLFSSLVSGEQSKLFRTLTLLIIFAVVPLTVVISQKQQETRQRASEIAPQSEEPISNISDITSIPTPIPTIIPSPTPLLPISFVLNPHAGSTPVGETFTVSISLNNTNYAISGVDTTIKFDNALLTAKSFIPSSLFASKLINTIDAENGLIHYAAVEPQQAAKQQSYELGTLTFIGKSAGVATLRFQNSQITALDILGAVPTANNDEGTYTITQITPTPTTVQSKTPPCGDIGDVDGNGILSEEDTKAVLAIVTKIAPYENPTPDQIIRADVNGKDGVTAIDALQIQQYVLGTGSAFSACIQKNPTQTPKTIPGDANGDGVADILDYNMWRDEYLGELTTKQSDFNNDGIVDLLDFNIWRNAISS